MRGGGGTQGRFADREALYRFGVPLLALIVRLLFRVRVVGLGHVPRRGPVLITPNHVSHLDPVVLAVTAYRCGRRLRFLATAEVFGKPVVGPVLRLAGQIPVERGGGREAMQQAGAALRAGKAVVIYPEGTIPRADRPQPPARPGAGGLAVTCHVPVVPVALWGMQRSGAGDRFRLRRPASVVFGPPLDPSRWAHARDRSDHQAVSDDILAVIRELMPVAQELVRGLPPPGAPAGGRPA